MADAVLTPPEDVVRRIIAEEIDKRLQLDLAGATIPTSSAASARPSSPETHLAHAAEPRPATRLHPRRRHLGRRRHHGVWSRRRRAAPAGQARIAGYKQGLTEEAARG
jgi:hypothetical protein